MLITQLKAEKNYTKKIEENLNGWVAGCDICRTYAHGIVYTNETKKRWLNLNIDSLNWDDNTWREKKGNFNK